MFNTLRVLLPGDAVITTWELRNAASAAEGARRKRLGAMKGWPDLGVFWNERVAFVELKRERGGYLSPGVDRASAACGGRVPGCGLPLGADGPGRDASRWHPREGRGHGLMTLRCTPLRQCSRCSRRPTGREDELAAGIIVRRGEPDRAGGSRLLITRLCSTPAAAQRGARESPRPDAVPCVCRVGGSRPAGRAAVSPARPAGMEA